MTTMRIYVGSALKKLSADWGEIPKFAGLVINNMQHLQRGLDKLPAELQPVLQGIIDKTQNGLMQIQQTRYKGTIPSEDLASARDELAEFKLDYLDYAQTPAADSLRQWAYYAHYFLELLVTEIDKYNQQTEKALQFDIDVEEPAPEMLPA